MSPGYFQRRAAVNATNRTLIHVLELSDRQPLEYLLPPTPRPPTPPLSFTPPRTTPVPVRQTETVDVRPGRPVVIYFRRRDAGRGVGVLEVVPAVRALRDRENCDLTAGDPQHLFAVVDSRNGAWSLQFTGAAVHAGVYRLQLTCWPLDNASSVRVTELQPFSFDAELHVH